MTKLAIINFEKKPDSVYKALELQYFDDNKGNKGYRVLAYRIDGYVDVYDDLTLNRDDDENLDVAGKGLGERRKIAIKNTVLEKTEGCVHISFSFSDKIGRAIVLKVKEYTNKKNQ